MLDFLREQNVNESLIRAVEAFRDKYPVDEASRARVIKPGYIYYGREIWEQALTALLCGENLLLAGSKATGKNVLAENLSAVFGRPGWNLSFHINMDASYMIGTDTFKNGQVIFRPGPVYQSAIQGGFCILDEINMARNEALAVLHSVLDFRKVIDVPGYSRISMHEAARFIATMNYGYAGTRDLNEALASRFVIIKMPEISKENLDKLLAHAFPALKRQYREQFGLLFSDITKKSESGEISMKALDLRGLMDSIRLMQAGLSPLSALDMGITNKTFDSGEQAIIRDIITARFSKKTDPLSMFERQATSGSGMQAMSKMQTISERQSL